jgi:hypothetical protein
MKYIQIYEHFTGYQEIEKVDQRKLGDIIDKSMTTNDKPILIYTESGEMGTPQFQQILSEMGISASFVDLGRSLPKDLNSIVGAEVVVASDLDDAPENVASIVIDKATQGDTQYIFTASDLEKIDRNILDRCKIVSYLRKN